MKVASFRELMREQANAAVQVSGAHHSSWNGRFGARIDPSSRTGGMAHWDHTISYNSRSVEEPLQEMFRNNRVHLQDRATLVGYRDAMRVVLHENVHLLSSEGNEHSQAEAAYIHAPGVHAIEEGVTELYSHQHLNDYLDELGIDQVAPGIKEVRSGQVYKDLTPAVEGFAETIERRSGVSSDELIDQMASVPADQKFSVAAQAVYDNSELPGLVPSDQRNQAVAQIAQAMGQQLDEVERLPGDADGAERRTVGAKAAGAGYKAAGQLKRQWQTPPPAKRVERGVGAEQQQTAQPGQGRQADPSRARPPHPQGQGPQQGSGTAPQPGRGPGPGPAPGRRPQPGRGQGPGSPGGLPPDVAAAARAGLSGPPLASASRLSADRQGARGTSSTTPAVQRQGPETQR